LKNDIISWLATESGIKVHLGVFCLLILGGLGFPVPEDIPLLLAGVAAQKELVKPISIFATSYIGVILADQIVFLIGYYFGPKLLEAGAKSTFFPSITEKRICEIRDGLRKRRLFYIFLGRHLFPVRTVTFLTAGALRIPYLEFLLSDALAAFVSVSIVTSIGYILGGKLTPEVIETIVKEFHFFLILILAMCLLVYLSKRMFFRKQTCK